MQPSPFAFSRRAFTPLCIMQCVGLPGTGAHVAFAWLVFAVPGVSAPGAVPGWTKEEDSTLA
jgi:hypothetical protein